MKPRFQYDPADHGSNVVPIDRHVTVGGPAVARTEPVVEWESNSYHGFAIRQAKEHRLSASPSRHHI